MEKDKNLLNEINQAKKWMNFLDNDKNYNKSFHKSEKNNNPKLIKEMYEGEDYDYDDTPEEKNPDLILGGDNTTEDDLISNEFFIIAVDTKGDIHVDSTDSAENKEEAMDQLDDNMYTNVIILDGVEIDSLMDALYDLRGVTFEGENDYKDNPPFIDIDGSSDEIIDEEDSELQELREAQKLLQKAIKRKSGKK